MAYAPVLETLAPLVGGTPDEVDRYRKLAEALLAQSQSGEPVEHWMEGVGRIAQALSGTLNERKAAKLEREGEAGARQDILANLDLFAGDGGGGGYAGGDTGGETADVPGAEPVAATGDDADMIIRTVIGEAAGEPPEGQQAVASVILNRAKQSGMTPSQVVLAKNQFEPWGSRASQLRAIDPNSEQYRRVAAAVLPVLQGQASDPTGGATHFYAPRAQAALGRSTPSWARGQGRDIGNHRFYSLGYPGGGRHGTETADIPGAEPVGSAPSPEVMAHITGGGATPAGMAFAPPAAPPPAPVASVPPPTPIVGEDAPVAGPPVPPPVARMPQPRPAPPIAAAPAAPAVTGSVTPVTRPVPMPPVKNDYAQFPGRRPSVAPVRPGQLMNEPWPGVMSAQEFARQGQAAMRARAAGQQPVGVSPTGQPSQPRRNLLQALLGRGGPQGPASPPAAPAPSAAPAGGAVAPTAAPVDARRAQIASLLSNPRVPDALKLAALKNMSPKEREAFTLSPGQVRYGPDGQPVAAVPATPEKREKTTDANGIPRWVDTGEPVFSGDVAGGKAPPKITDVAAMRKELHGLDTYKRYAKAAPVFNSLSESFGKNTRAGDLDFVYAMATIFDPESVVREGEQILVRNTANLPDQVVNGISSLMSGTGQLDGETRRNLYDVVHGRMQQYREAADTELAGFPEMAGRWGINPADIMPNLMELKTLPGTEPAAAAAGSSRDNPVRPASDADIESLPSDTYYVAPDGSVRRKR